MKKRYRVWLFLGGVAFVVLGPYLWSRVASPGRRIRMRESSQIEAQKHATGRIRVACYNIAHGRGLNVDNWTDDSEAERLARLDEIAELLREVDADVVALNEVDFACSWSHGVNQAEYLAEKAGYRYFAEERNLDFRVVNYTWKFGNAILSKHPIKKAEEISYPSYQTWENRMAGKKRGICCELDLGNSTVRIASIHLSHRSEDVRVESARMLCDLAKQDASPLIIAGDFNSTPPGFALSKNSAAGENAIAVLDESQLFHGLPESMPDASGMTFRADDPTHVIDWIMIPASWQFTSYEAIDSTLSDHRPIVATIETSSEPQ